MRKSTFMGTHGIAGEFYLVWEECVVIHRAPYTVQWIPVLWTPWDQPKVSTSSRLTDFPGHFIMIKCHLGPQLSDWIMQVSSFSGVHINRFYCTS